MDYEKLYRAYFMQVYSYALTLCRSKELAEEIAQETFFRAMNAGESARFCEKSKELTWLCAIAKNIFIDQTRENRRRAELGENVISGDDVEKAVIGSDLSFRIHIALHSLDEPYKEVFQLRVFGELSFAKIGALFGKTENWARVTYHRAKLKITERMGLSDER